MPALEKTSSASKNFCRVLDIRVTEVMEPHVPKSPVNQSPKYYCFPMGQPGQPPLYLSYYSDNSNNIIPIPLILFRNAYHVKHDLSAMEKLFAEYINGRLDLYLSMLQEK